MELIEQLEATLADEESYFRQHLVREDVARLRSLQELASTTHDLDDFLTKGMGIGWTQNDMRTHQIKDTIQTLLCAVHAYETGAKTQDDESALLGAWRAFDKDRMEKLIRCL